MNQKKDFRNNSLPINEFIKAPRMQVITAEGENAGIVSRDVALKMARDAGLDLVLITEQGREGVPIVKIVDYGKVLYAKKKKQAEAKKHQKTVQIKEIKIRPKIGEHDYLTKLKQASQFLKDGKHVKITIVFRGREGATSKERGAEMFDKIAQTFEDFGLANVVYEKESRTGMFWSRIYFLKK